MDSKLFFYEFGKLLYKIDGFYSLYAKNKNIKENELWILYALNDNNFHSQKEISDNWDIPRTTINTITKDLEKRNIISLSQIKGEKRELIMKLTSDGKNYANNNLKDIYRIEKEVFISINSDSTNILDKLSKIYIELEKRR